MPSQILLFFKETLSQKYQELADFRAHEFSDAIKEIDIKYGSIDKQAIYDGIKAYFQKILDNEDYDGILRVFNLKNALIPNSKVCEETGVRNKEEYRKLLITLLKKDDANSKLLKDAIKAKIIKTPIVEEIKFVCPPIPPIASDRLRRCGLFAQISLVMI